MLDTETIVALTPEMSETPVAPDAILARLQDATTDAIARREALAQRHLERAATLAALDQPLAEARERVAELSAELSATQTALVGARVNVAALSGTSAEAGARARVVELQARLTELPRLLEAAQTELATREAGAEQARATAEQETQADAAADADLAQLIEGYQQRVAAERGKLARARLQQLLGELATRIAQAAEQRARAEAELAGVQAFRASLAQRMGDLAALPEVAGELNVLIRDVPSPLEEALEAERVAVIAWRDRAGAALGMQMPGGVPLYRALLPNVTEGAVALALQGTNTEFWKQRIGLLDVMLQNVRQAHRQR